MSKKNIVEGAVADSVSLEEANNIENQEAVQESEGNASTDKFINECKDFIVNYAKTCYDYPEDQAYALREFFISKRIEDEAATHQKNMNEADIVVDTVKLIDIATDLMNDFLGKHEEANDRIAEIMMHHVPGFQAELNMRRERMEDKK